jgi:hypothetical protein
MVYNETINFRIIIIFRFMYLLSFRSGITLKRKGLWRPYIAKGGAGGHMAQLVELKKTPSNIKLLSFLIGRILLRKETVFVMGVIGDRT